VLRASRSAGMCCPGNRTCGPGSRRTPYLPSLLPGVARTLAAGRGGDRCTGRGGRRVRGWVPSQRWVCRRPQVYLPTEVTNSSGV